MNDVARYEFYWPGIVATLPLIMLFIVLPAVLIYSFVRYSNISKTTKFFMSLCSFFLPLLICAIIPFTLQMSGVLFAGEYNAWRRVSYSEAWKLFGGFSLEVYTAITTWIVISFCMSMKNDYRKRREIADRLNSYKAAD